jgi:hypothetical protein
VRIWNCCHCCCFLTGIASENQISLFLCCFSAVNQQLHCGKTIPHNKQFKLTVVVYLHLCLLIANCLYFNRFAGVNYKVFNLHFVMEFYQQLLHQFIYKWNIPKSIKLLVLCNRGHGTFFSNFESNI